MFHSLAVLSTLYDGYKGAFNVKGKPLLLIQEEGKRYIIEDRCPHMDAKLSTGTISNGNIHCRVHGIAFSLSTGKAQGPLASTLDCLSCYSVVYDGNKIGVDL